MSSTLKHVRNIAIVFALAVTLTATDRLWQTSAGSVAWLVLMGASLYAGGSVLWSMRRY